MELKHGSISADDHVQEHPEVWTSRMSRARWGDRIPHLAHMDDGTEEWMIEGWRIPFQGGALAAAAMAERNTSENALRPRNAACAALSASTAASILPLA